MSLKIARLIIITIIIIISVNMGFTAINTVKSSILNKVNAINSINN